MSNKLVYLFIFINNIYLSNSMKLDNKTNFIVKKKINRTDNSFIDSNMYSLSSLNSFSSLSNENLNNLCNENCSLKSKLIKNKKLKLKDPNNINYYNEYYHDF